MRRHAFTWLPSGQDSPALKIPEAIGFKRIHHPFSTSLPFLMKVFVQGGDIHELLKDISKHRQAINGLILSCTKQPLFPF